jgi:hypothetical protein
MKLSLGRQVITPGALAKLSADDVREALARHARGDWGDLDHADCVLNDQAVTHGGRVLSARRSPTGTLFWIITEADRSVTTVLLPEEY